MVGLWCLNPGWMVVSALIVLRYGIDHPSTQISDLLPHCVPCPGPPWCHAFSQALVTVLQRVTVLFPPPHPICLILSSHKAQAMSHSPTVFFNSHLMPAVVFIGHFGLPGARLSCSAGSSHHVLTQTVSPVAGEGLLC